MSQADSAITTNADLLALASRLRDGADNMLANRQLADDLRTAADLASRWANIREGWEKPDLSAAAIVELESRLNDTETPGSAVTAADMFLAIQCTHLLGGWIFHLTNISRWDSDTGARDVIKTLLEPLGVRP